MSERMALVGIERCGCITAAMIEEYASPKERRDFYREMGDSDRTIDRRPVEQVRADPLFLADCPHGGTT